MLTFWTDDLHLGKGLTPHNNSGEPLPTTVTMYEVAPLQIYLISLSTFRAAYLSHRNLSFQQICRDEKRAANTISSNKANSNNSQKKV